MREFSELRKRYWGCHLCGKGYFCSTVGAVTEEIVKKYIEDQNEENSAFKIWDEKKNLPLSACLQILNILSALADSH